MRSSARTVLKKKDYRLGIVKLFGVLMIGRQRLALYVLVTAIIEGSSIVVLYSSGYPHNAQGLGVLALMIALNFFFFYLLSMAIGGPQGAAPPGSWIYNPLVQLVAGVVGMFIIVVVIGEGMNWLRGRMMKMTGTKKELSESNEKNRSPE